MTNQRKETSIFRFLISRARYIMMMSERERAHENLKEDVEISTFVLLPFWEGVELNQPGCV